MADDEVTIFGVRERNSGRIRYVGYSKNPRKRLDHIREGRNSLSPMTFWLRTERDAGVSPSIIEFEKCPQSEAKERVEKWKRRHEPDLHGKVGRPYGSEADAALRQPGMVPIGWSVRLTRVIELAHQFRISNKAAILFLVDLGVPMRIIGDSRFFDMFALECALHRAMLPEPFKTRAHSDDEFALWLQSVAAYEYAGMDAVTMKARLKRWHREMMRKRETEPKGLRPSNAK